MIPNIKYFGAGQEMLNMFVGETHSEDTKLRRASFGKTMQILAVA